MAALVFASAAFGQQGQTVTVSMEDNYFAPASITVEPGTTVTWVQNGQNPHTTTSYDGLWDSGIIEGGSGGTFSYTFNEPGTYEYFCIPHEDMDMVGVVNVTEGAGAAAQASPGAAGAQQYTEQPLPTTGGPALLLPAAGVLLMAGLLGMRLVRRS